MRLDENLGYYIYSLYSMIRLEWRNNIWDIYLSSKVEDKKGVQENPKGKKCSDLWPLNLFAESAKYNAYWDQVQRRNI